MYFLTHKHLFHAYDKIALMELFCVALGYFAVFCPILSLNQKKGLGAKPYLKVKNGDSFEAFYLVLTFDVMSFFICIPWPLLMGNYKLYDG